MGLRITLDPGHFLYSDGRGYNAGVNSGYYEGTAMFKLAYYLKEYLEAYGATVFVTRKYLTDNPSLSDRGKLAGTTNSEVFISLHSNATGSAATYESAYGVEIYRSVHRPDSVDLGTKLVNAAVGVMKPVTGNTYNRGTKIRNYGSDDYFGVMRSAATYSCVKYDYLIEHGFHTNSKECTFLGVDDNLKKIAKAEADVFAEYFNLKKVETSTPTTTTETTKPTEETTTNDEWCKVKVYCKSLNIRNGPSTRYKIIRPIVGGGVFNIDKQENGWGYLRSKLGWIRLSKSYVTLLDGKISDESKF